MSRLACGLVGLVVVVLAGPVRAADHPLRGVQVRVMEGPPGSASTKRRVVVAAKSAAGNEAFGGDPTLGGVLLTLDLGTAQESWVLLAPQWRRTATGFVYADARGVNGPVASAGIKRAADGRIQIKATASGTADALRLGPPNPGRGACLQIDVLGGDGYHALFPPPPGSTVARNDARAFVIARPTVDGLCVPPVTTTTTTLPCAGAERDPACPELQPEILAVAGREVWLDGARLVGEVGALDDDRVVFDCPDGRTLVVRGDARIREWSPTRLRLSLPPGVDSRCTVEVYAGRGASGAARLRVYAAQMIAAPVHPIVLDRDRDGHVWIGAEFSASLFHLPPDGDGIETIDVPTPPGFFRSMLGLGGIPDAAAEFSGFVEHVVAAPDGSVWLSQGGWPFYRHDAGAPHPNGSRLVRYEPATNAWRCYNVPSDSAEVIGLALLHDGTVLVAAGGDDALLRLSPAALDGLALDDCGSAAAAAPCAPGQTVADACWEAYPLPRDEWHYPAHVREDTATGDWWTVGAESNQVLRYVPATATWSQWTLPATARRPGWWWPWDGAQPWWFALGSDGRVRTASFVAAALDELEPTTGAWRRRAVPTAGASDWSFVYWHATDDAGRLWVSGAFGAPGDLPARALAYWPADGEGGVFLPPLDDGPPAGQNGISGFWISGDARTVYGARLATKEVVRLEQVP